MSKTSALWRSLTSSLFASVDDAFVDSFREPGRANSRLASWDPFDNTMRYYKFMLFNAAEQQPDVFFDLYRNLGPVDIGNPVSITVRGCKVNIDYLFSVEEFMFVAQHLNIRTLRSVIEIGAGFGRTCHAILALAPSVAQYTIVDLKNVMELSRRVLKKAVPAHFHKITFIDAEDVKHSHTLTADLAINIDSFQEMPASTIDGYMTGIVDKCKYFYVKNPIGKYRPESIGLKLDEARFHDVFSLGYCRDLVDIFDDESLKAARAAYVAAYRPAGATLIADKSMNLFPYLHHALYRNR
jgi:putative sugar O-methyltransferase